LHCARAGILASHALRRSLGPSDCSTNDPMHVLVSNGTINTECYLVFAANGLAQSYDDMRVLSGAAWCRPKMHCKVSITRPFDTAHQKATSNNEQFKCQASELLSVLPLIRYYVDSKLATKPTLALQVRSFRNAHDLLSLVQQSKLHGNVDPDRIDKAAARHLRAKIAAYTAEILKPKDHQECMHLGDNARKFGGRSVDCFTQERKGATVKAAAESIAYHNQFERTAMLRVIHEEVRRLSNADLWSNRLLGKREDFPEVAVQNGCAQCECAATIRWNHAQYSHGDVIVVDEGPPVFIQLACCLDGSEFVLLVTPCRDGVALTETSSRWKLVVHGPAAWPAHQLRLSRVRSIRLMPFWSYERADSLLVLEI
jgi:hypothetical protein